MRSRASSVKPALPSTPRPPPGSVVGRYASTNSTGSDVADRMSDLEQVARQLVDPVAVLEDGDHRRLRGSRAQADREQVLERRLAQLRVEPAGQVGVRDRQPDDVARAAARARRAPRSTAASCRRRAAIWRSVESSSSRPNRRRQISRHTKYGVLVPYAWHSPNATVCAGPPDVAHELRHEARLAHAGLGRDRRRRARGPRPPPGAPRARPAPAVARRGRARTGSCGATPAPGSR